MTILALSALLGGVLAQSGTAAPVAHESNFSACDISGEQQNLGASYVTSLKVQGVSCTKGEKVIEAYHQCRHQSGGPAGTCGATLLGFKCKDGGSERRAERAVQRHGQVPQGLERLQAHQEPVHPEHVAPASDQYSKSLSRA